MQEIASGVYVETSYSPYNVGLVVIDEGVVAIDVPPRPADAEAWRERVEDGVGPIRYAVLTDAHPDRIVAAALWDDIDIVASEATLRAVAAYEDRPWRDLLQSAAKRYNEGAEVFAELKPHLPTIAGNRQFFLYRQDPPLSFEVLSGAAVGSLTVLVPDERILFTGDMVSVDEPPSLENTPDSKEWLNTLGSLAHQSSVRLLVPGRGRAPVPRGDLEQMREFMRVARRTAQTAARRNEGVGRKAQDMGQAFYMEAGQRAVKSIKRGLEALIEEIERAEKTPENEDES